MKTNARKQPAAIQPRSPIGQGVTARFDRSASGAFTLIELLVVIAIIGILAGLLFTAIGPMKKNRMLAVAKAELAQVQTAIESYKAKLGYYPPDNPNNTITNTLYFELCGTTNNGTVFGTLDGSSAISQATLSGVFGRAGFSNSSKIAKNTDDAAAAVAFLKALRPNQIGQLYIPDTNTPINALLICSVGWQDVEYFSPSSGSSIQSEPICGPVLFEKLKNLQNRPPLASPQDHLNPWHYVSTNPTNNPGSYDLWVDVLIGTKTNRVSNWSKTPQVL